MKSLVALSSVVAIILIGSIGAGKPIAGLEDEYDNNRECDPHPPIWIPGDLGFLSPLSGVRSGSGTETDPFIIEGWCIHTGPDPNLGSLQGGLEGIWLGGTTMHTVVRDNVIVNPFPASDALSMSMGLLLEGASNVSIENNTLMDNRFGVYIYNGFKNIEIKNNRIIGHQNGGIRLVRGGNLVIEGNDISGNNAGVDIRGGIRGADNITIVNNVIANNSNRGITMSSTNSSMLKGNEILGNGELGLALWRSQGDRVEGNVISGNNYGIKSSPALDVNIIKNDVNNNHVGIGFEGVSNSYIQLNLIHENTIGVQGDNLRNVNATLNWWGCPEGPKHDACNRIEGNVTYDPWLQSPDDDAQSSHGGGPEANTTSAPHLVIPVLLSMVMLIIRRRYNRS